MAEKEHPELVIIKRRASHDDGHHGGAWKIAFADFMTAMMALFLVLWLISSTSDKTKHAVAQYFNPVKLVDVTTLKKGFRDPRKTEMGAGPKLTESKEEAQTSQDLAETREVVEKPGAKARTMTDATLFRDPYAALAEIAASAIEAAPRPAAGEAPADGASSSDDADAFLDPFTTAPRLARAPNPPVETPADAALSQESRPADRRHAADTKSTDAKPSEVKPSEVRPVETKHGAGEAKPRDDEAAALQGEIAARLKPAGARAPRVEVESTSEGLLVSLTDDRNFTMFKIGSAVPEPETVKAMGVVGALLKSHPGVVIVRGHTDARPYRRGDYDNWRLSAARAHMAHYMLARGGLDDRRIERIEGYADRRLKTPADPLAPANRRIEILVRKEKP